MKKLNLFAVLCCLMLSVASFAQEHLKFKGIPITGPMTSFCKQMQQKGFTKMDEQGNVVTFEGKFTGRYSTVFAEVTKDKRNVFSVVVMLEPDGNWKSLVNNYNYYKSLYTKKYGDSGDSNPNNPSHFDDNVSFMYALEQGKVVYASTWLVGPGCIDVSIQKSERPMQARVVIVYQDMETAKANRQNDLDEI